MCIPPAGLIYVAVNLDFAGVRVKTAKMRQQRKDARNAERLIRSGGPAARRNAFHSVSLPVFNAHTAAVATVAMALTVASGKVSARADHTCDPLDSVADVGWSVVPSDETVGQVDSAPFQGDAGGAWFVNRTTTIIPFCNYYNELGIYSMRSYTLAPREIETRIRICQATAQGAATVAVPPYAGRCPPR